MQAPAHKWAATFVVAVLDSSTKGSPFGMETGFKALILTHKQAGVQLREAVALSPTASAMLQNQLRELTGASDLLVLSTCNRTEFYYSHAEDLAKPILTLLETYNVAAGLPEVSGAFKRILEPTAAAQHLGRVALGLESQVPGDMQIIHQVKEAYQQSADAGAAGPYLHRLLHTLFFANKRVVSETSFRTGAASVAYAAQSLAEEMLPRGTESRIVVLGVGEMGANLCRNLASEGYRNVVVLNRTLAKAQTLATETGLRAASLESLAAELAEAEAVISCVAAPEPVLTPETLAGLPRGRRLLIFDLSVPRSVAPACELNPAVLLYNIDELEQRATAALQARIAQVPLVEQILAEALAEFADWSREMLVGPAIQRFKGALEQIRQDELARYLKNLSPEQMELVEKITGSLVQRIVKLPVLELKAACRRGDAEDMIGSLASLFKLER